MSLLSTADREAVRDRLSALVHPVRLVFFTQTFGEPESAVTTRSILRELASLSPTVTVEDVNFVLDKDRAAALGITGIPAIAIMRGETDTGMRFLGAPAGYEFASLVDAIVLAGTDTPGLSERSLAIIGSITEPVDIKVFVTPTCPHCPRAVTLSHKMAVASPFITATCIEATEFLALSRQFHVTGVPKTVVNETIEIMGSLPEDDFVSAVFGRKTDLESSDEPQSAP